jgi:hypothetical protein
MSKLPRSRKPFPGSVCKPCWELKYCPYGDLVEYFPFASDEKIDMADIRNRYQDALSQLTSGELNGEEDVWEAVQILLYNAPAGWKDVQEFDPRDVNCLIYGHVCPVFLKQSGATETKATRSEGRVIPREIMLKVVRRDDQHCQVCLQWVPDNMIEFDHVIPYSKGGPTSLENLRLLCRACNRKKSNRMDELLDR